MSRGKTSSPRLSVFQCPDMHTMCVDLANWDVTRKAVQDIGPIHLLVNNAGVVIAETFMDMTSESLDK